MIACSKFAKALQEYRLDMDVSRVRTLTRYFDKEEKGTLSYRHVVQTLIGKLSSLRKHLVDVAFLKLDRDGSGVVNAATVKDSFRGQGHPDVADGKREEEAVVGEFCETLDMHAKYWNSDQPTLLTKAQWDDFYTFVSASIDADEYFERLLVESWNLKATPNAPFESESESEAEAILKAHAKASSPGTKGLSSFPETRQRTGKPAPFAMSEDKTDYMTSQEYYQGVKPKAAREAESPQRSAPNQRELLYSLRKSLCGRGVRGLMGFQRALMVRHYKQCC